MEREKIIAMQVSHALKTAREKDLFEGKHWPFCTFPDNCCEHACDLLGYFLLRENIHTVQINGAYIHDPSVYHVWLKTDTGIVIDITEEQFGGDLLNKADVEKVRVGSEGPVQKLFCKKRIQQPNVIFWDPTLYSHGMPSPRQRCLMDVYNIIVQFMNFE